ncbi:hypothetical protein [Christiangramia sabulilitoris]|uniref:Lipoprotein n=1 Tax=Christiangramia sabulilitoris TaxID=2583991 RepID=A0A550I725_9FLAO|nr:hypothetical protein [Christiangramia sabulilitoris]TRO66773.1 hypothetical protein FGM01_02465 [Christiangramia sabulilitoris]
MKRISKIIFLFIILGLMSCSSSFIKKERNSTIKLNSIPENTIKIGIENDAVILKFNRNDLIYFLEKKLEEFNDQRIKGYVSDLKSIKSDTIFDANKIKGTLPFAEYEIKFHELLKKGDAIVFDKEENKELDRIKYKFTLDKLGGEDAYFYKMNGKQIYHILLAFGE